MRLFGDIMSRVILTVIYLVMALPLGLVAQRFSDPLQRRGGPRWHPIDRHGSLQTEAGVSIDPHIGHLLSLSRRGRGPGKRRPIGRRL